MALKVAGVHHDQQVYRAIRSTWALSKLQRHGMLWVTAPRLRPGRSPWMDRAEAIAAHCRPDMVWDAAAALHPGTPAAPPPAADVCAVCLDDFPDAFPAPAGQPARPGHTTRCGRMYTCSHAVCRGCDHAIQRSVHSRCPLCRAPSTLDRLSTLIPPAAAQMHPAMDVGAARMVLPPRAASVSTHLALAV